MPIPRLSHSESHDNIALLVGGGGDPLSEYVAARLMCEALDLKVTTFVCNDSIHLFPDKIDHAVTLHPDKMSVWLERRRRNGFEIPTSLWAHRSYPHFTAWTKDWQGSSGLFMVKIARELGFTKILLCGIPMSEEADHITRHVPWHHCQGFMRGWRRWEHHIKPHVRSMSGWTQETFGAPDDEWLRSHVSDPRPMYTPDQTRGDGTKA